MPAGAYRDDATIPDSAALWRRIPPKHFFWDEKRNRTRPSSAAFDDDPDGAPMSVTIAEEAPNLHSIMAGHEGYGLASVTAELVRGCDQIIVREPLPDNPAHAVVVGNKTDSVRRRMAYECHWIVAPPQS